MKLAPTFSYSSSIDYVRMSIIKDGKLVHTYVYSNYEYAIMYFNLIKKYDYNTYKILKKWNQMWNDGSLDGLKYDLSVSMI